MGMGGLNLLKLPEPTNIKELIKQVREGLNEGENIEYDSQAVWSLNKLPKYLWNGWKEELRRMGVNWQIFLRILKLHTLDAIEWALRGTLTWEGFLRKVSMSIEHYGVKKVEE